MSEPQPKPEKIHKVMEGRVDAVGAIDEVIAAARIELCVFDVHVRGMVERGFASPARCDALRALLLGSRNHRLRIALHDIQGFESGLPRLLQLLTQFSGQIQVHRTTGLAREAADPLVVADDCHFWHKLYIDHPRSVMSLHDAQETRPLKERFEEIWDASELGLSGTTLGL